jgi:5-methylcytosine-specific restriction protein B
VEEGYQHLDYAQRVALANEYYAFLSRMTDGDIVATVAGDQLSAGVVTGEPTYDQAAEGARLRRAVAWQDTAPVPVDSLPAPLPAEVDQQGTVVDLTGALDVLSELLGTAPGETKKLPAVEPVGAATVPALPSATPDLAVRLHMDQTWLQELIDLLQERQQVVLYGPPGTGKTYLAQEIARHIAERDAVRLVQFHPSYAYEDFFEGFRPASGADGSVTFPLTAGPLRMLASDARANPGEPYVLVVDEINRANLAKVFGELYFLLEYRNAKIGLQYSPGESFSLPPNVFFIGTMNTADRSIALVDAAIRRRFAFVELHPDDPPVRDVLANWLLASHKDGDERPGLLRTLNDAIDEEDRDFKIGPSYLMRPHSETSSGLDRVWRYDLLPLLEEHYYGRLTRSQVHARFGLDTIRRRLAEAMVEEAPAGSISPESSEP